MQAVISTPPHDDPYQVWITKDGEFVSPRNRAGYFEYERFTPVVVQSLNNYILMLGFRITSAWHDEMEFRFASCERRD